MLCGRLLTLQMKERRNRLGERMLAPPVIVLLQSFLLAGTNVIGDGLHGDGRVLRDKCIQNVLVILVDALERGRVVTASTDSKDTYQQPRLIDDLLSSPCGFDLILVKLYFGMIHTLVSILKFHNIKCCLEGSNEHPNLNIKILYIKKYFFIAYFTLKNILNTLT